MNDFACFECGKVYYGGPSEKCTSCCGKDTVDVRFAMGRVLAEIVTLRKEVKTLKEMKVRDD